LSRIQFAALVLFVASVFLYTGATQAQEQSPKVLAKGEFHNAEKAGKGTATIYQLADGKRVLRLSNFETDNGPDLHVRLIAADDATDTASVAKTDYVEVAKLKGTRVPRTTNSPRRWTWASTGWFPSGATASASTLPPRRLRPSSKALPDGPLAGPGPSGPG
jgi:Electron transfer DM13